VVAQHIHADKLANMAKSNRRFSRVYERA